MCINISSRQKSKTTTRQFIPQACVANKVIYISSEVWMIVPHNNSLSQTVLSWVSKYLMEPFNHWLNLCLWKYYFPLHFSIISRLRMGDQFVFIAKLSCDKLSWVSMIPILKLKILDLSFIYSLKVQCFFSLSPCLGD